MADLNLTKSKFMEYIRCRRFPALNEIYKRKDFDDAMKDRFYDIINSLDNFDFDGDDGFLEPNLEHLQVMMPYYSGVEVLAARKVMSEWQGETKFGTEYGTQKLFIREHNNFNLMCYIDIFNKQEKNVNIIEVKATTSNKFLSMTFSEKGVKIPLFYRGDDGIVRLSEERDPSLLENTKYMKKRAQLKDRYTGAGTYINDIAFQRFVIEEEIVDATYYLGVLNHEYVFDGTYSLGEPVYTNDSTCFIDVTKITKEMLPQIQTDIEVVIERIINEDENRVPLGKHCQLKKQRECIYKDLCYDSFPEKNSILMYIDKHHGFKDEKGIKHDVFDLIDEGYYSMQDVPHEWLTRRNNQIQRDCAITKKTFFDLDKLRAGIKEIKYPIYHLDFESFPCPLPRFKGETAYMQSVFQFSLHIEREPGNCDKKLDHYEYLSDNHQDNRLNLVEKLIEYIKPDGGSIMVYNQAFEKTRIKELAQFFPEYKEELLEMNTRLFDLMNIVKTNSKLYQNLGYSDEQSKTVNYYSEQLAGSYSIKKVLPIFSSLSYKDLVVGNGMEAVYAYAGYSKLNKEDLKVTLNALSKYCQQDTWAMVEILDELRKL